MAAGRAAAVSPEGLRLWRVVNGGCGNGWWTASPKPFRHCHFHRKSPMRQQCRAADSPYSVNEGKWKDHVMGLRLRYVPAVMALLSIAIALGTVDAQARAAGPT